MFWRLCGIRHVRYAWWRLRLEYHLYLYHGTDIRMPSLADLEALDAIWDGRA
jgi:hypothetical protein